MAVITLPEFTIVKCDEHVDGMSFARDGFCNCCGSTEHEVIG